MSSNSDKERCEKRGGEYNERTGECRIPSIGEITAQNSVNKKQQKKKCEDDGGKWVDPPGRCEFPTA